MASEESVGDLPPPADGERYVADDGLAVRFQYIVVLHVDKDWLTAIKTTRLDSDFFAKEKPAHGQRFQPSLSVPLLFVCYRHQILGGDVGKGRP